MIVPPEHSLLRCSALLLSLALAACAPLAPPLAQPAADLLPKDWANGALRPGSAAVDLGWWQHFGSPELDELIAKADRRSYDIAAAVANLRQAQALARAAGAPRWPALDLQLNGERSDATGRNRSSYDSALTASYELDVWGRVQATHESALAAVLVSRFDAQAVRLGVQASVANAWLEGVALREQIAIAEQDGAAARRTLALVEARRKAGAAGELDATRQRGVVAERDKSLAALGRRLDDVRMLIARLCGEADIGAGKIASVSLDQLALPDIDAGLPSELLVRRPDLARAEAQLAAADADIAAARAALLPTVNLGAAVSGGGGGLLRIMDNPAYTLLAAISAPVFNAGRLSALRAGAEARRESLLAAYRNAVVAAFADTQEALNAIAWLDAQYRAQQAVLAEAERTGQLADTRYRAGAAGMLDLLDAQRTLYAARSDIVQLRLARLQASVALYRALGGGWQKDAGPERTEELTLAPGF